MRCLQLLRNWLMQSKSDSRAFIQLSHELESLLDLCCYAAARALAYSKLIERELNESASANEDCDSLAQEHSHLQTDLEHLRMLIETLHHLLNSARTNLALGESRVECESSRQMIAELLAGRDVRDLEWAVKNLEQKSTGSEL